MWGWPPCWPCGKSILPQVQQTWLLFLLSVWTFFQVESFQWLTGWYSSVFPASTWRYRVSTGTGWPGVSMLWLGDVATLIYNFCLSVAALLLSEQICLWNIRTLSKQQQQQHVRLASTYLIFQSRYMWWYSGVDVTWPSLILLLL